MSSLLKKIRSIVLYCLELVIIIIDYLYPKDDNLIIFGSSGGIQINGNPLALFEHALKEQKYQIFFYLNKNTSVKIYPNHFKSKIISNKNLKELLLLFKARVFIGSHGLGDFGLPVWSKRKIFIQTWHGIGPKQTGFADPNTSDQELKNLVKHNNLVTAFLTTSKIDSGGKARCFNLCDRKLFSLGYPRNDILLKPNLEKFNFEKVIPQQMNNAFKILYCPTFRKNSNTVFFPFSDFTLPDLHNFSEQNNILFFIRGHKNDKVQIEKFLNKRIIDLNFNKCPDITPILSGIDLLITDYSSIYMDFLLLNRPIIFIPYDLESYLQENGFIFDSYKDWSPGCHASTYKDFKDELKNILNGTDIYKESRLKINRIINANQTENSAKLVFELVEKFLDQKKLLNGN